MNSELSFYSRDSGFNNDSKEEQLGGGKESDYDGRTALHIACAEGHIEVIKLLLKNNIRIQKDRWDNTPINVIPKEKQNKITIHNHCKPSNE